MMTASDLSEAVRTLADFDRPFDRLSTSFMDRRKKGLNGFAGTANADVNFGMRRAVQIVRDRI